MPIPPDTDPGSLESTDATSRRLATPPELLPPRLPSLPVARGSRRVEAPHEGAVTTRLERIDPDPAPLPPSPAAAEASRWLARTRPGSEVPTPLGESNDTTRPLAAPSTAQVRVGHSTGFTALLAVTMLVVGMVLGALIAGR